MQEKLTQILNDIYTLDPALREQDSEVRSLVSAFLAEKPTVELTTAFKQILRASLVKPQGVTSQAMPWWMFYVAPLGVAAVVILMLIPDYDPNYVPAVAPQPTLQTEESVGSEANFESFEASDRDASFNTKRAAPAALDEETSPAATMQIMGDLPPTESFLVSTQVPGNTVVIDYVSLLTSGYVVIHTEVAGELGEIIGVSPVLPDGLSEQVVIPLSITTKSDQTFFAFLYFANGDGEFEKELDLPIYDATVMMPVFHMFSTTPSITI